MLVSSLTHFSPPLSVATWRNLKIHQAELSCLICMQSKFCKSISGKCAILTCHSPGCFEDWSNSVVEFNLISWLSESFVNFRCSLPTRMNGHFHLFFEQNRKRRGALGKRFGMANVTYCHTGLLKPGGHRCTQKVTFVGSQLYDDVFLHRGLN